MSDIRIPFWSIMGLGVQNIADSLGYDLEIYSADNDPKRELELTIKALRDNVSGIVLSPTTSSAATTILKFSAKVDIPVVIADIGTDDGEYVSYISSDNYQGAYNLGEILSKKMKQRGWDDGSVCIIAIPQKRANGRARTIGFMQAINAANIRIADMSQQVTFSYQETYDFSKKCINQNPNLKAIWLQGSDKYQAALDAIITAGKQNEMLLVTFDAEPIFLDLIPQGILAGSAMQQPYLIGQTAVSVMHQYINGKSVPKNIELPILAISAENIADNLSVINKNVLGITQ